MKKSRESFWISGLGSSIYELMLFGVLAYISLVNMSKTFVYQHARYPFFSILSSFFNYAIP